MNDMIRYLKSGEALKELDNFETPYQIKKSDLEFQAIPEESFRELSKKGSSAFIDNNKHIFIKIGGNYFGYVGIYAGGFVLTRYPVSGIGLSVEDLAKIFAKESELDNKRFMKKLESQIYEHLEILEVAGVVKKNLIPLTSEMVEKQFS